LAKEGAKVIATDINEYDGQACVDKILANGGEGVFFQQDVSLERDWQKLMTFTMERYGRLDIHVNCAGVFLTSSIEGITLEQWRWVMSVSLDGVFLGIKYAAKAMKKMAGDQSLIYFQWEDWRGLSIQRPIMPARAVCGFCPKQRPWSSPKQVTI